jgi:hypothetical protein
MSEPATSSTGTHVSADGAGADGHSLSVPTGTSAETPRPSADKLSKPGAVKWPGQPRVTAAQYQLNWYQPVFW